MVGLWWVESIQPTMFNPFGAKVFPYVGLGLDHFSAKTKNFPVGLAEFLVGLRKITGRPKRNAISGNEKYRFVRRETACRSLRNDVSLIAIRRISNYYVVYEC